jgi:RHS repeat-associated protein
VGATINYTSLTRKERNIETGLDYFINRYYSSTQARFTSPDEFKGGPDEVGATFDSLVGPSNVE